MNVSPPDTGGGWRARGAAVRLAAGSLASTAFPLLVMSALSPEVDLDGGERVPSGAG